MLKWQPEQLKIVKVMEGMVFSEKEGKNELGRGCVGSLNGNIPLLSYNSAAIE